MPRPIGQDLRRYFHIHAPMKTREHGAWMSTGDDAMQLQVSNPDESWYGLKSPGRHWTLCAAGNSCLRRFIDRKTRFRGLRVFWVFTRQELIRNCVVFGLRFGLIYVEYFLKGNVKNRSAKGVKIFSF